MGSNYIQNTRTANLRLWNIPEENRNAKQVVVKKRGSRPSYLNEANHEPETPFRALRFRLKQTMEEWKIRLGVSMATISHSERGSVIPTVALAKRMQEEARQLGLSVTLDELYQHVIPLGYGLNEEGEMVKVDERFADPKEGKKRS